MEQVNASLTNLDFLAVILFFIAWIGYTYLAKRLAKTRHSLASVMHGYRADWMHQLLTRSNPIADASIVTNLERNTAFFTYACMFLLAGLFTLVGSAERVAATIADLPGAYETNTVQVRIKLLLLIVIFTYGFFTFTWGMRQYGFVSILIGGAPNPEDDSLSYREKKMYAESAAKVVDLAGKQFNYGLRCYYFALAALAWFHGPIGLMISTTCVVTILYRREFRSRTLKALVQAREKRVSHEFDN